MIDTLKTILGEIDGVLSQVDETELGAFLDTFSLSRRVFVDGEGRSVFSAKGFAMRLMHLGYTVYFVGETITPALAEGDLFVAVSGSGKSANIMHDAMKAHEVGAFVYAVTSKRNSPLAELADAVLVIPGTVKGDSGSGRGSVQLLSSLFDQCTHIVLDAACLMLSQRERMSNDAATQAHW